MAPGEHAAYPRWVSLRKLALSVPLGLGLGLWSPAASAQFHPEGRSRPKAATPAKRTAPRPASVPRPGATPPRTQGPSTEALIDRYMAAALSQPGVDFPLQRLAELYRARDGKLDALIRDLEAKAEKGSNRFAALLALAGAHRQNGDTKRAIAIYEKALGEAPDSTTAELSLARLLEEGGEREQARQHYEKALSRIREPVEREQVLRTLMRLALDAGDLKSARTQHQELVKAQKGSFFVRAELGRELLTRGLYQAAEEELAQVVKAAAGDNRVLAPALRDHGLSLFKLGRRAEAKKTLERALGAAGRESGVRRQIYETLVELYRSEGRIAELLAQIERRGARDTEEQRILASLYEETGQLDKAERAYRAVLARSPKDVTTRLKVVRLLETQGKLEEAIREYEGLTRAAPRNPEYVFRLVGALLQRGDRKAALDRLRALETRSANDEEILSELVEFYTRIGEEKASLALLQRLSARGSADPGHLVELGARYWDQGDKEKALQTWQRVKLTAQSQADGLLTLGELYLEHDLIKEALDTLKLAVEKNDSLRVRKAYALSLERAGTNERSRDQRRQHHDAALAIWEKILKETSTRPELAREARQHIVTLWNLSGSLASRKGALQRRLDATPPDLGAGRLLAEAELRLRRYAEAERVLRQVVERAPGDVESLSRLERVLGLQHKRAESIEILKKLVLADPTRAREHYQRMAEYSAELYRDDDALEYATRAVALSPDDALGHKKLGEMYAKRGDVAQAVASFRKALEKNERLFPVYFELSELLMGQGQPDQADLLLRRVLRTSPDEELLSRAARLSLQINLGRGTVETLEQDLLPLSLNNPDRPVYRRLLVELYGALSYPLLDRVRGGDAKAARQAEAELRALGERAVKPLLDALSDPNPSQQETAISLLTFVANKSAGPALLSFSTGKAEPRLRVRAMLAVGALADPARVADLTRLLGSGTQKAGEGDPVLVAAAWSLAKIANARARPALLSLTRSTTPGLRALGILGLSKLRDRTSQARIGEVLAATDTGPLPRAAAAFAVGELKLGDLSPRIAELTDAPDPTLRSTALIALARLGGNGASESIARQLMSSEPEVQRAARSAALVLTTGAYRGGAWLPVPHADLDPRAILRSLSPTEYTADDERRALERLAPSLERAALDVARSSPEGARAVLEALSPRRDAPPFSALLLRSASDPATQKRAEAIADGLKSSITSPLLALAEHPSAVVRSFALTFLSERPEPAAVESVVRAVRDQSSVVQRAVLASLTPRHAAAAPAVVALLGDEDWSRRAAAARALGRLIQKGTPPDALHALERAARADRTALVREAALQALAAAAPEQARSTLRAARDTDPEPHVRSTAESLLRP